LKVPPPPPIQQQQQQEAVSLQASKETGEFTVKDLPSFNAFFCAAMFSLCTEYLELFLWKLGLI
jgi:hypothetical protein